MKHYLSIKFKDASLILPNKASRPLRGYTHVINEFGVRTPSDKFRDVDCDNPIGISQVSNMLHVMLGYKPKPSYRKSFIERNEEIYNIAKTARILYEDGCDELIYEKSEVFQGSKSAWNSNASPKTTIGDTTYPGFYSWSFFFRRFKNFAKDDLIKIMNLFNKVLGCEDVSKSYKFDEFVLEFSKHSNDKEVVDFLNENPIYLARKGGILNMPIGYLIFRHTPNVPTGNNTSVDGPTPLLESKEVSKRKAKLSGEIIVEFDGEEVIERLNECGVLPTILDGGIVTSVKLYNEELPITSLWYNILYKKIEEQKELQDSENE